MTIRTVIADDEPLARERLDALLRADPDFEIVRLAHFKGEQFDMRAEPLAAGGFEVAVELPYERGPA